MHLPVHCIPRPLASGWRGQVFDYSRISTCTTSESPLIATPQGIEQPYLLPDAWRVLLGEPLDLALRALERGALALASAPHPLFPEPCMTWRPRTTPWIGSEKMIQGYRDKRTRTFAAGKRVRAFDGIALKAEMHLDQLDAATSLLDLDLPGNRLEALKGDRKSQYSIRINDQC